MWGITCPTGINTTGYVKRCVNVLFNALKTWLTTCTNVIYIGSDTNIPNGIKKYFSVRKKQYFNI